MAPVAVTISLSLLDAIRPDLCEGNAAFHRGFADARWGSERPKLNPSHAAYRCYMLGWTEGSLARAAASN
jgi:hypothetical protein